MNSNITVKTAPHGTAIPQSLIKQGHVTTIPPSSLLVDAILIVEAQAISDVVVYSTEYLGSRHFKNVGPCITNGASIFVPIAESPLVGEATAHHYLAFLTSQPADIHVPEPNKVMLDAEVNERLMSLAKESNVTVEYAVNLLLKTILLK